MPTPSFNHQISDYLTVHKPFGPEDASLVTDPFVRNSLFQNENALYKRLNPKSSLVIGRKGSGKTAFLYSTQKSYHSIIELNSASAFALLLRTIENFGTKNIAVEPIAELWNICFWLALFFHAPNDLWKQRIDQRFLSPDLRSDLLKYISGVVADNKTTQSHYLVAAFKFYSNRMSDGQISPEDAPDFIKTLPIQDLTFDDLQKRLENEMETHKIRASMIIDSLDPRTDTTNSFDVKSEELTLSVSALLKALALNVGHKSSLDVKLALPSERHMQFLKLSTNPAKDMVDTAMMRWTAGDLVCVAAHRLKLFYREHAEYAAHYATRYIKLDTKQRRDAATLMQVPLGKSVINQFAVDENTISYILRYTQLLPRHLLLYLNSIFSLAQTRGENFEAISQSSIQDGIKNVAQTICYEIFAAFQHNYPWASQACEKCLPELTTKFTMGDLQTTFTRYGKKVMGGDDFDQFKRMLIEMGVIGRLKEVTEIYFEAIFEYSSPHQVVIGSSDYMCVHPVFSEVYNSKESEESRVVYPYGSAEDWAA